MAPADPANAVAVGTTQKPLLGLTAQASSDSCPRLLAPRVSSAAPRMTHKPAERETGPTSSLTELSRQAATRDKVAEVARIWPRRNTGQARRTCGPLWAAPQPTSAPTTNQSRLSTH